MGKGIDVSNFTGNIGTSKATELKTAGFDFAIVGAQIDAQGRNFTQSQIDDLRAGGPVSYTHLTLPTNREV